MFGSEFWKEVITFIFILFRFVESSQGHAKLIQRRRISEAQPLQLTPKLSFEIKLHAFLFWLSFGFLVPVGILIIKMSNIVQCTKRAKILFYSHVIVQIMAVVLATAGAILSLTNFENSFSNTHQRIGLALYALIWIQPLIACVRPHRGVKARSLWYFIHWLLGTSITALGITNIYIGLQKYEERISKNVRIWTVLFTVQVSIIAFVYLLQDKWEYMMKKQRVNQDDEQVLAHSSGNDKDQLPTVLMKKQRVVHELAQKL